MGDNLLNQLANLVNPGAPQNRVHALIEDARTNQATERPTVPITHFFNDVSTNPQLAASITPQMIKDLGDAVKGDPKRLTAFVRGISQISQARPDLVAAVPADVLKNAAKITADMGSSTRMALLTEPLWDDKLTQGERKEVAKLFVTEAFHHDSLDGLHQMLLDPKGREQILPYITPALLQEKLTDDPFVERDLHLIATQLPQMTDAVTGSIRPIIDHGGGRLNEASLKAFSAVPAWAAQVRPEEVRNSIDKALVDYPNMSRDIGRWWDAAGTNGGFQTIVRDKINQFGVFSQTVFPPGKDHSIEENSDGLLVYSKADNSVGLQFWGNHYPQNLDRTFSERPDLRESVEKG
jgi:hypothetical protein